MKHGTSEPFHFFHMDPRMSDVTMLRRLCLADFEHEYFCGTVWWFWRVLHVSFLFSLVIKWKSIHLLLNCAFSSRVQHLWQILWVVIWTGQGLVDGWCFYVLALFLYSSLQTKGATDSTVKTLVKTPQILVVVEIWKSRLSMMQIC
jgi:hypothetical protein